MGITHCRRQLIAFYSDQTVSSAQSKVSNPADMAAMIESEKDVADQLIAFGCSEEHVSSAQRKAANPRDPNGVLELITSEMKVKSYTVSVFVVSVEYTHWIVW